MWHWLTRWRNWHETRSWVPHRFVLHMHVYGTVKLPIPCQQELKIDVKHQPVKQFTAVLLKKGCKCLASTSKVQTVVLDCTASSLPVVLFTVHLVPWHAAVCRARVMQAWLKAQTTAEVFKLLNRLQHPQDCASARKLVCVC